MNGDEDRKDGSRCVGLSGLLGVDGSNELLLIELGGISGDWISSIGRVGESNWRTRGVL